ncbi:hypothetical protein G7Y79_00011g030580 [Physcia stellaris]|nr:hypothetical protein G7Y79_00011g030580 [Physcia stellaris]
MSVIELHLTELLGIKSHNDQPLRDRASTRTSRTHSYRSTPTDLSPITLSKSRTPSSGGASPLTGKIRSQAEKAKNLVSWTSSRDAGNVAPESLDVESLKDRLASRDFSAEPESVFDDSLLEPRPYERVQTNLSEIITAQPNSNRESFDLTGFGGHRDTFAILGIRRRQHRDIDLPVGFFERLVHYISFNTYLAIRLSCRSWSAAISQVRPPWQRAVTRIPVEIMEQIYYHLSPVDFNAARHTCRVWMIASLETRLLTFMLKRGGWWTAALADQALHEGDLEQSSNGLEWLLSKRVATECALRLDWAGNGLSISPTEVSVSHEQSRFPNSCRQPALTPSCEVDFSKLSRGFVLDRDTLPLQLVPSTCGRYLILFQHRTIFVFCIGEDSAAALRAPQKGPQALKSFTCPQRVLAVSMDTSSGSYLVAALLEDRIGLVCNLAEDYRETPRFVMPKVRIPTWVKSAKRRSEFLEDEVEVELPLPLSSLVQDDSPRNPWALEDLPYTVSPEQYDSAPSSPNDQLMFRNVCSTDHPPLSVAVSPQRLCVAFGCTTGIELHWKDLVSDQKQNRWFPSEKSSEYLYFLAPRLDDTSRQLRLISSSASPEERASILERLAPHEVAEIENAMVLESMSDLGFHDDHNQRNRDKPSYYKAKPCSDGWHVLFLDAESGHVSLGVDNQDDETIGKRLSTMATFLRPNGQECKPTCYAVATELSWGPRIVVGYEDGNVYVFSVPADIFRAGRGSNQWDWLETWGAYATTSEGGSGFALWPVQIQGIEVGHIDGLVDVAVQGDAGGVRVWAFSSFSRGYSWELDIGQHKNVRFYKALNDELGFRIEDEVDQEGDWKMEDAPLSRQEPGYDGTASESEPLTVDSIQARPRGENSDISMHDADEDEGYFSGEDIPFDLDTRVRAPSPLNNTPLHRSDVSMHDASEDYPSQPIIPNFNTIPPPSPPPNPHKRRRLNTTPTLSLPFAEPPHHEDAETRKSGFDPDRQTIEWVSSAFALSVPGLKRRWSGSQMELEAEDWVPDFGGWGRDGGCGTGRGVKGGRMVGFGRMKD